MKLALFFSALLMGLGSLYAAEPAGPLSEDALLKYATTPFDHVERRSVFLGELYGTRVIADFICGDICPDYTVRLIHYELKEGQACSDVGGVEKEVAVPVAIAVMNRKFCFPKILVTHWDTYRRTLSPLQPGGGQHP